MEIVEKTNRGRCLVASRDICRGELVETSHCILVTSEEYLQHCKFTVFENYLYKCASGNLLLPLGAGCLFNHSETPNIDYKIDEGSRIIRYFAAKDIHAHEEMVIYYGANLWFQQEEASENLEPSSEEDSDHMPFKNFES